MKDLSKTFEENPSRLAEVTGKYIEDSLDTKTPQRLDEGVGSYKNKVVFKFKDNNYYYFSDLSKGKGGREVQKIIRLTDSSLVEFNVEFTGPIRSGSIMV